MINVAGIVNNPKISRDFIIYRKNGEWLNGRFEEKETSLVFHGVISVAKAKELEWIPEGDRVGGELMIHCTEKIFTTRNNELENDIGTSDELLWNDERYKIYSVSPYSDFGFYKAIAMRKDSC